MRGSSLGIALIPPIAFPIFIYLQMLTVSGQTLTSAPHTFLDLPRPPTHL